MSCFDRVTIELQWVALYIRWVVTYPLKFMVCKYMSYKASCKTPFFHTIKIIKIGKIFMFTI